MEDFLLMILIIPVFDRSLQLDVYKGHNLPTLHPDIGVQFSYIQEGQYLTISKHGVYASIPTEHDIRISMATKSYPYMLNQSPCTSHIKNESNITI